MESAASRADRSLLQNLEDAGCSRECVKEFLALRAEGKTQKMLDLLDEQRGHLLDRLHKNEKQIDCLDYLVYQIQKRSAV